MSKNYYNILGIDKSASNEEIKKAFRALAHKYHPDKKDGDEQQFKEINEAYQVLSNDKKRAEYDSYGRVFSGADGGRAGFGGFDFSGFQGAQEDFDFGNLNDIFSEFFSGGGRRGQARRGRDISTEIQISFAEAIFGVERKILINKVSVCDTCSGTGAKDPKELESCSVCNGQGKVHETKQSFLGTFSSVKTCDTCFGKGQVSKDKCVACKGLGVAKSQNEITIMVPAGINNGEMIRMGGMGEAVSGGMPGDLYIKISVLPHLVLRRDGYNLTMTLNIKLSDALLGAEYTISTLDGDMRLKIPKGVSIDEILRVRGKGVPHGKTKRGDLLVKLNITFPSKLSKESEELVKKLKDLGI